MKIKSPPLGGLIVFRKKYGVDLNSFTEILSTRQFKVIDQIAQLISTLILLLYWQPLLFPVTPREHWRSNFDKSKLSLQEVRAQPGVYNLRPGLERPPSTGFPHQSSARAGQLDRVHPRVRCSQISSLAIVHLFTGFRPYFLPSLPPGKLDNPLLASSSSPAWSTCSSGIPVHSLPLPVQFPRLPWTPLPGLRLQNSIHGWGRLGSQTPGQDFTAPHSPWLPRA